MHRIICFRNIFRTGTRVYIHIRDWKRGATCCYRGGVFVVYIFKMTSRFMKIRVSIKCCNVVSISFPISLLILSKSLNSIQTSWSLEPWLLAKGKKETKRQLFPYRLICPFSSTSRRFLWFVLLVIFVRIIFCFILFPFLME